MSDIERGESSWVTARREPAVAANGMTGSFLARFSKGSAPELEVSEEALSRKDIDFESSEGVSVLVRGCPYREGGGWLTARDVLREWSATGAFSPADVHGMFTVLVHDTTTGRLSITRDRFGGLDVFVAETGGGLLLSDSIEDLVSRLDRLTLDERSVLEFLYWGQVFGDRTHFTEVRKMRCATIAQLSAADGLRERVYWRLEAGSAGDGEISSLEFTDRFFHHIGRCFELANTASVSLTGGMDSRPVLAACLSRPGRYRCFTYGPHGSRDVKIASLICGKLGVPHSVYFLEETAGTLAEDSLAVASTTNGMTNFILFSNLLRAYEKEGDRADVLMTGVGNDLNKGAWIRARDWGPKQEREILPGMLERTLRNRIPGLVRNATGAEVMEATLGYLRGELEAIELEDRGLASEFLCLRERTSNMINYIMAVACRHMKTWNAWMHAPLLELSSRLAVEDRLGEVTLRLIVESASKTLARVPAGRGEWIPLSRPPARARLWKARVKAGDFGRKAVNKVGRMTVRREPVRPHYYLDFTDVLVAHHRRFILETLDYDSMVLAPLIDPDVLAVNTDLFLRGYVNLTFAMTNLMCLELWLKRVGTLARLGGT